MSIISETGVIMVTYTGLSGLYTGIMMIKIQFLEFTVDWGKPIMDSCHAMTLGCQMDHSLLDYSMSPLLLST